VGALQPFDALEVSVDTRADQSSHGGARGAAHLSRAETPAPLSADAGVDIADSAQSWQPRMFLRTSGAARDLLREHNMNAVQNRSQRETKIKIINVIQHGAALAFLLGACTTLDPPTIGVGVASELASLRAQLPGTAVFVFQPAEETLEGARAMLADHAFADLAPAAIYAVHTGPLLVGTFGLNADMAGQDHFKATLLANPDAGALERAVARLKALGTASPPGSSTERAPGNSVPTISARPVYAVIDADTNVAHPRIEGWLRAGHDEDYPLLRAEVRAILAGELPAAAFQLEFANSPFPSMRSDRLISERARPALIRAVGESNVVSINSIHMFNGEDFALWLQQTPGAMFILGVANPKRGIAGVPHSPTYDADEKAIPIGTKAMSLVLWPLRATEPVWEAAAAEHDAGWAAPLKAAQHETGRSSILQQSPRAVRLGSQSEDPTRVSTAPSVLSPKVHARDS
jgi:metal-dependent amidase/aminoacylase/carboxypeptidase family protein